jgi:hypothetical protein
MRKRCTLPDELHEQIYSIKIQSVIYKYQLFFVISPIWQAYRKWILSMLIPYSKHTSSTLLLYSFHTLGTLLPGFSHTGAIRTACFRYTLAISAL